MGGDGKGPQHLLLKPTYVDSCNTINSFTARPNSNCGDEDLSDFQSLLNKKRIYEKNPAMGAPKSKLNVRSDLIRASTASKSEERLYSDTVFPLNRRPRSLHADAF